MEHINTYQKNNHPASKEEAEKNTASTLGYLTSLFWGDGNIENNLESRSVSIINTVDENIYKDWALLERTENSLTNPSEPVEKRATFIRSSSH